MKMKKLLAMTAVIVMIGATFTGCGNKAEAEAEKGFDNTNDITVVSREDGSGTRGAFIELFGVEEKGADGEKVDMTTVEANITNSTSVMMSTIAGNDYGIGYISLGSLNDSVKALKIDGAEATAENIKSKAYKVSRPFNIATTDKIGAAAQDFINFMMSADGQKVVEEAGYIAVDEVTNYTGSQPEGKIVVAGSSSVTPVMEKLKEAYLAVNPKAEIEIQQSDSSTGMTSTLDGICDIGMASRELKDTELEAGLKNTVIAIDGIAVIVNNNNTMDELSSEQVKTIFTGEALTWDEVTK